MSPYRPPIRKVVIHPPKPGAPTRKQLPSKPAPPGPAAAKRPDRSISPLECVRVARVAKLLDVSKKRIYQLVRERRLEVIRLGPRQMRILKSSLEKFVGRLLEEEAERDY